MRTRLLCAALVALALVPFLPALIRGEIFTVRDHTAYFVPLRYFTVQHLLSAELPFWNPLNASGERWLANPQTAVFYPPSLLFLLFPFASAYVLFLAFHVVILGLGAFFLFRLWVDDEPAFFAASALALAGPTMSIVDVSNNLGTFAWFPLVIWCALKRSEETRVSIPIAVPAFLLAMLFLGGEPFLAIIGAVIYSVIVLFRSRTAAAFREIASSGGLAAMLCMVQLVPFVEMLIGSDREAGFNFELAFRESMHPLDWSLLAISPALFGRGGLVASSQSYIPILYVGMAVVVMALVSLARVRDDSGAHRRVVLAWTALLAAVGILAAGSYLGPGARILEAAGMSVSRYPARLVPLGALSVCALAAIGANALKDLGLAARIVSGLSVAGMFAIAIHRHGPLDVSASPAATVLLAAQTLVLLFVFVFPRQGRLIALLALMVSADLLVAANPLLSRGPFPFEPPAIVKVLDPERRIARLPDLERLGREARYDSMPGYTNLLVGIQNISTAAPVSDRDSMSFHEKALFTPRPDLLRFLSVGYIIAARPISSPYITPHFSMDAIHSYALSEPWPMATGWRENGSALRRLDAAMRASDAGIMERFHPDIAGRVERLGSSDVVVRMSADVPVVAVLNQLDAKGWTVQIDGEPARGTEVGGLFRAVRIPSGEHLIHWRYRPPFFMLGVCVSLLTAIFLVVMTIHLSRGTRGVVGWRNRRTKT